MKQRILLVVVMLLIATPAFATVNIAVTQGTGDDVNKLTVTYNCTGSEAVRAFALNFALGSSNNSMQFAGVNSIGNFIRGESNATSKGYGIFPGQFRNQINPAEPNWVATYYTPVAPDNDVDSNGTGFGTRTIIAELGTLYKDANAPGTSGTLFSIRVDDPNSLGTDTLVVSTNAVRGGVILENGSAATTNLPTTQTITITPPSCTVPVVVNSLLADANTAIIAAGLTVGTITYQADNAIAAGRVISSNPAAGATPACGSAVAMVVSTGPADCLYVGRVFSGPGITTLTVTQAHIDRWVTLGKPNCWCCPAQKRGNGVYTPTSTATKTDALDLAKVKNTAQWSKSLGEAGYNANPCLDTNLSGKIDAVDLARVKNTANWGVATGAGSGCP